MSERNIKHTKMERVEEWPPPPPMEHTPDCLSLAGGDEMIVNDSQGSELFPEEFGPYTFTPLEKKWRCPKGHEWVGAEFYMAVTQKPADVHSGPLCPYCILEFLVENFPAEAVEG